MKRVLMAACLVGLTTPAGAQIVNVQPLLSDLPAQGFVGEASGSADMKSGNVKLLLASASLLMLYRSGDDTYISSSAGTVGFKGGYDDEDRFLEKVFTHLRYQRALGDRLTWEAYAQVASDEFKRLSFRGLAGTGPRITLVQSDSVFSAVGLSYMYEHERLGSAGHADDGLETETHRASTYLTARIAFEPSVSMVHTTYFQPALDRFASDFRVSSDTEIAVKISEGASVGLAVGITYDEEPPLAVEKLDTSWTFKLGIGF